MVQLRGSFLFATCILAFTLLGSVHGDEEVEEFPYDQNPDSQNSNTMRCTVYLKSSLQKMMMVLTGKFPMNRNDDPPSEGQFICFWNCLRGSIGLGKNYEGMESNNKMRKPSTFSEEQIQNNIEICREQVASVSSACERGLMMVQCMKKMTHSGGDRFDNNTMI